MAKINLLVVFLSVQAVFAAASAPLERTYPTKISYEISEDFETNFLNFSEGSIGETTTGEKFRKFGQNGRNIDGNFSWIGSRHIALLVRPDYKGELQFAHRVQAACENLHWQADILNISDADHELQEYDFVINLVPGVVKLQKCPHYLAIFHPVHHYFKPNGKLKKAYAGYDGYLLTYSPAEDDKNFSGQKRPYIRWYPTIHSQEYQEVNPVHLFHLCCLWGNRFNDPKMQQFLISLDQEKFMRFYGNHLITSLCPKHYCSSLPFDSDTVCETIRSAGVALVIHSDDHNAYGQPSGRIFEAAASSSVIICDENAFVKKHFGDSVLYVDTSKSAESISDQVKNHMRWIRKNKAAALEKAKKAHSIYRNLFLLEDQLTRLCAFHDHLTKNKLSTIIRTGASWAKKWNRKIVQPLLRFFSSKNLIYPTPLAVARNRDYQYSLINSVDFDPRKNVFCATYTHNNKICFFEISKNHELRLIQTLRNPQAKLHEPQHAVFSPDEKKLFVANWTDQTLNIYARNENGLFCETPHAIIPSPDALTRCKPHEIAFSPCGNYLAIAYGAADYFEHAIALFRVREADVECIHFLKNADLPGTPKGIAFSPDGTHLLTTFCDTNSLAIFTLKNHAIDPNPKQILSHAESGLSRPENLAISPDGLYCAITNSDKHTVTFYPFDQRSNSISQNHPAYTLQNPGASFIFPHGVAFSPDGAYLVVTQFGPIQLTEQGDIFGDSPMKASNAAINLYEMRSQK